MSKESLYTKEDINRLNEFGKLVPESIETFHKFEKQVLSGGYLTVKLKELIAIAVAHTTGCPYCIEIHTKSAKRAEATKEEVAESIIVAVALKAGSAMAHGVNALNAFDNVEDDELYKTTYFNRLSEFSRLDNGFKAFVNFDMESMKPNTLELKEKELIAIAVAHTTGCPYCIEIHTKRARNAKATKIEIAESIMIATALKAGSAMAHGINALNAYDR